MRRTIPDRAFYPALLSLLFFFIFVLGKKINFGFFTSFAAALQKSGVSILTDINDTARAVRYASIERKKADEIIKENKILQAENESLKTQNEKLTRMMKLKQDTEFTGRIRAYTWVVEANTDGFLQYFMIGAGSGDGVQEGDGVVAGGFVLGRVVKVMGGTSLVQLLTDARSSLSVRVQRNKVIGILTGKGIEECEMGFVPKDADVLAGDNIVTSGLSKSFPEGYRVGRVTLADKRAEGLSINIKVKPFADIFSTEEVIVLKVRQ